MPQSLNGAYPDHDFEILWEDSERVVCRGQCLADDGSRSAVLVVLPAAKHPSSSSLDRLAHEYGSKDELDAAWAVQPLELVHDAGRTMLVLEDPGGEPLDRLLGGPLEVASFLRLAIGIAKAVGKVHGRDLVHKDIKPANILVNSATGEVKLTGFRIASRLTRERQAPEPPETIAGTLAYMAPEQTGRINRSIDSRSDLYSLGVTLYQMLTGSLPLTAGDPMEWVHWHIARKPVPPAEQFNVPAALSAIVMKLLAKTAEERYQTASGLERDLQRCLAEWETRGRIDDFRLGEHDSLAGSTTTIAAPVEHLDLTTVLKISQAVSGEIVQEKLLEILMRTAIEQAGAERGVVVLSRWTGPRVAAQATTIGDGIVVQLHDEALSTAVLPKSVVQYVLHTKESVVLDDAAAQNLFSADPYIQQHHARSILCMPLLHQGQLTGALYLENKLTSGAFAPARIAVLKLLASQAAISLVNARLYYDLAQREAKIRRLVDADIIGIFIWDFEGQILDANKAFLRMVEYEREDLVAGRLRWTDLTPQEWKDRDARLKEEHKMSGVLPPIEKECFRKNGSRVPVLIGAATFEEGGNEGVAFVLDLTERKRAEDALRESEAKFRDYAETASDWYWEIGPDYKFTQLSEKAFGSNGRDRIGTMCWDRALDLQTEPEKWRLVREALDARKPFRDFVYCSVGGNGSPMYVKASGKPVFDTNGEFRGYRGTGSDATAIIRAQRAEESLRAVEAELAHVNRVTTLGELAASIAHEVKQPIAATRNNARAALNFLGKQSPDLDEVREALECIVGDADRAGHIVDRIRDHIKKAPPRKDRFDINIAIDEVVLLARSSITNNGVSVRTRLAEGLSPVHGDRVQLQQVVLNLILNAVDAMSSVEPGVRELSISTERLGTNGVSVAVRDTGPGIDPKHLDRVFEAFYTTKPAGVGMGLSICRSIIDAHGGRLWADANVTEGALFQFTLPGAGAENQNPLPAAPQKVEQHENVALGASRRPAQEDNTRFRRSTRRTERRYRRVQY